VIIAINEGFCLKPKGNYINAHLVAKSSRTLPKKYDEFISQNIELVDKMPEVDELMTDLPSYEA
jgi:hypothetical protein